MPDEVDFDGLRGHIIETIKLALEDGRIAYQSLAPAYTAWTVTAVQLKIAERARSQTFVTPEDYARIAATVLRETLEGGA